MRSGRGVGSVIYYIVALCLYAGFLFHRCDTPSILSYSTAYFAALVIGLAVVLSVPAVVRCYVRSVGWQGLAYSLLPTLALITAGYFLFSLVYYHSPEHRKMHLFDPYLQVPNARFDIPVEKDDHTFRILCLGGSTTEGGYPEKLKSVLQDKYPRTKIEVLNAGKIWYTTKHSLINYVTYCRRWKPDLVIVMHAINDLYRSFSPPTFAVGEYDPLWSHFYGPSIGGVKPEKTFEAYVSERFVQPLVGAWFSEVEFIHGKPEMAEVDYPLDTYVSAERYEYYLRTIVHCVRADGAKVLLMSQPSLYKEVMDEEERKVLWFGRLLCYREVSAHRVEYPSPRSLRAAMEMFNRVVEQVAAAEGTGYVDLAARVPGNLEYFIDDCHYTELGTGLVAATVAGAIAQSQMIDEAANILLHRERGEQYP